MSCFALSYSQALPLLRTTDRFWCVAKEIWMLGGSTPSLRRQRRKSIDLGSSSPPFPLLFVSLSPKMHFHVQAKNQGLFSVGRKGPEKKAACGMRDRFFFIFLRRLLPTAHSEARVLLRRRSAQSFVSSSSRSIHVLFRLGNTSESTWTFVGQGTRPSRTSRTRTRSSFVLQKAFAAPRRMEKASVRV